MGFFIVRPVRRETNQSPYSSLSVLSQVKCVLNQPVVRSTIHNDFSDPEGVNTPFETERLFCDRHHSARRCDLLDPCRPDPTTRKGDTGATEGDTAMLAWQVLAASAPAIVCVLCAAFLAYQQRPAWGWFLGLSIGAQFAAVLLVLQLRGFH
jgi:hypothetical protein